MEGDLDKGKDDLLCTGVSATLLYNFREPWERRKGVWIGKRRENFHQTC